MFRATTRGCKICLELVERVNLPPVRLTRLQGRSLEKKRENLRLMGCLGPKKNIDVSWKDWKDLGREIGGTSQSIASSLGLPPKSLVMPRSTLSDNKMRLRRRRSAATPSMTLRQALSRPTGQEARKRKARLPRKKETRVRTTRTNKARKVLAATTPAVMSLEAHPTKSTR